MNDRGRAEREALLLGFLRAAQVLERRLEESFAAVDLTAARYWVLELLGRAGRPLPLREIAERLSCVRSNVTQLVDRLEADGLVRRTPRPGRPARRARGAHPCGAGARAGGRGPVGWSAGGVRVCPVARGPGRARACPGRDHAL